MQPASNNQKFKQLIAQTLEISKGATVELGIFLLMASNLAVYNLTEDLLLEKACRINLGFSEEICDTIKVRNSSFESEEIQMQKYVANVKFVSSFIDYGLPIVVMIFLGPLSEVFGRKIPMLVPIIGFMVQFLGVILCAYFENLDTWTLRFLMSVPRAITGSEMAYNMAAMTYIADLTRNNLSKRSIRIGLFYSCFTVGVPTGQALSARLNNSNFGYVYTTMIASIPGSLAFILIMLFVKNTRNIEKAHEIQLMSKTEIVNYIFNPKSTWLSILKTLSKPRENFDRFNIFLVLVSLFCTTAPMTAEFPVRYLFLRKLLHWNISEFGDFSTFATVVAVLGVILSMGILSHLLKLSDPVLGFISGISQFSSCFLYAFVTTSFMIYMAPVVDLMNGTMIVVTKSILSKTVDQNEIGNLFAVIGAIDSISPLILAPIYTLVYRSTLETLPGAFYLVSAALTIIPFIAFSWLIYVGYKNGSGLLQISKNDKLVIRL